MHFISYRINTVRLLADLKNEPEYFSRDWQRMSVRKYVPDCLLEVVGAVFPDFIYIFDRLSFLFALGPGQGDGGEAQHDQLQTMPTRR